MRFAHIILSLWELDCTLRVQSNSQTTKFSLKKNIWGCFFKDKLGDIHIFNENMDANKYIQILKDYLIPIIDNYDKELIFQHDNDPKHKANKTKDFLSDNNIIVFNWPSCSPDISPIENVWGILKDRVIRCKSKTAEEFVKNIIYEWNNFDITILKSLINSMPYRILQLIENKGDYLMY